ncbi:MAG: thioredoxin family protein [Theionarchaea archaeon]|nr:thioredoxin family protein [Theionarchaea archaeon]
MAKEEKKSAMLKEKDKKMLQKQFEQLETPVNLIFFTQERECQFCRETHLLLDEVAALSDTITLTTYDFVNDADSVSHYSIDKIPGLAVTGNNKDYGIRFYGIPAGYEFTPLIIDILTSSSGNSLLQQSTRDSLKEVEKAVHIQVLTTPTCPYCPQAVQTAHQMAIESDYVRADMVGAVEFPQLAQKYEVFAVPKIVINETVRLEGVLPEPQFVKEILKAIQ